VTKQILAFGSFLCLSLGVAWLHGADNNFGSDRPVDPANSAVATGGETLDAARIITLSGRDAGIALVFGDEALAEAIVKGSRFLVVDQEVGIANHQAAARRADAAGYLANGRMQVVLASGWRPVLADASVNLVVIPAAVPLEKLDAKAVGAVLAPDGGTAILEKGIPGWLEKLPADIAVSSQSLTALQRGHLPGGDDWPQIYHGADQNYVSNDRAIDGALTPQWLGLPMFGTNANIRMTVAAHGRIFVLQQSGTDDLVLDARDLANGQHLWQHVWNHETPTQAPGLIATDNSVLLCLRDRIVRLAGDTGVETAAWNPDGRDGVWLNGMVQAGNLVLVIGASKDFPVADKVVQKLGNDPRPMSGDQLTAFDVTTGTERWHWSDKGKPIDARSLVVADGRVFFGFLGNHLTALNLADGKLAWSLDLNTPEMKAARAPNPGRKQFSLYDKPLPVVRAGQGVVVIGWPEDANMVALDAADGHLLWSAWHGAGSWMLREGRIVVAGQTPDRIEKHKNVGGWSEGAHDQGMAYDLRTGAMRQESGAGTVGCGQSIATSLTYWAARNGPMWNSQTNKPTSRPYVNRTACFTGQLPVVASGTYLSGPHDICICFERLRGWTAWRTPQDHAVREARLEKFSDAKLMSKADADDDADWTQTRGNRDHTGASAVALGGAPVLLWRSKPVHPYTPPAAGTYPFEPQLSPTPPVAAAGLIVVGGDDGAVRAYDSANGNLLWSAYTGARILGTPAIMYGRVYVGSGDGYLWCLALSDGRPYWRFRLPPNDQYIPAYGHLISRWPVVGILAADRVVYASAGFVNDDGGVVCAVDAATGEQRWLHSFIDGTEPVMPVGGLVLHNGQLWVRGASTSQVRLDAATGATLDTIEADPAKVDGADIGLFAGRYIVQGGRPWYWEPREYFMRRNTNAEYTEMDSAGAPLSPMITMQSVAVTPAWDKGCMLGLYARADRQFWASGGGMFAGGYLGLECWDADGMARWLDEVRLKYPGTRRTDWGYMAYLVNQAKKADHNTKLTVDLPPRPQTLWSIPDTWIQSLALASDTALVLCRKPYTQDPKHNADFLLFCDRDKGTVRAEQELPCSPVFNGLAIDRSGRVILSLQDGSLLCLAANPANGHRP